MDHDHLAAAALAATAFLSALLTHLCHLDTTVTSWAFQIAIGDPADCPHHRHSVLAHLIGWRTR